MLTLLFIYNGYIMVIKKYIYICIEGKLNIIVFIINYSLILYIGQIISKLVVIILYALCVLFVVLLISIFIYYTI